MAKRAGSSSDRRSRPPSLVAEVVALIALSRRGWATRTCAHISGSASFRAPSGLWNGRRSFHTCCTEMAAHLKSGREYKG